MAKHQAYWSTDDTSNARAARRTTTMNNHTDAFRAIGWGAEGFENALAQHPLRLPYIDTSKIGTTMPFSDSVRTSLKSNVFVTLPLQNTSTSKSSPSEPCPSVSVVSPPFWRTSFNLP